MENFIKKVISNQNIELEEINLFIVDYCKLMNKNIPTVQELAGIVQMIQTKMFDLIYAIKIASIKLNIQLYSLYDKHGNLIKMFIV